MDAKITIKDRAMNGTAHARRLRREGWIPGVIYSNGEAARSVSLPQHEFEQMLRHHSSEHVMVQIQIEGGKETSVLIKEIQHNALTDSVVHVDLQEVAMDKKLQVKVPVELVGEADGVKSQGGVLDHLLHDIEIECFPADIPETVLVDVSALKLGESLTVQDIPIDTSKYAFVTDADAAVVAISSPKVADVTATDDEAVAPEVIREKKAAAE